MSGKYSKETLRKMKALCEQIKTQTARLYDLPEVRGHFEAQKNNNELTQTQRNGAENLLWHLNNAHDITTRADNIITDIDELLNDTDYTLAKEEHIENYLAELVDLQTEMQDAARAYFITENHDQTPIYDDPAWPVFNIAHELSDTTKNLRTIQESNNLFAYKEIDKELQKEYKIISAFSCDGTTLENVAEDLAHYEKEYSNDLKEFEILKNSQDDWERKYTDAQLKIRQLPDKISQLKEQSDKLEKDISNAKEDLKTLSRDEERYITAGKNLQTVRKDLDSLNAEVNRLQDENIRTHRDAEFYQQSKNALLNRAGSNSEYINSYISDKERELKWQKIQALSKELQEVLKADAIAQTIVFAKVEQKGKKFLGINFKERISGIPESYMRQLENGIEEPARKERIRKGREIAAQMMELAPDKARLQEILVKLPSLDEKDYFDNMDRSLNVEVNSAHEALVNNPAYKRTMKLQEDAKQLNELLEKMDQQISDKEKDKEKNKVNNPQNQQDNKADEMEVLNDAYVAEMRDQISKAAINANKEMASNPVNINEIDKLVSDHINATERLSAEDERLENKKIEQSDVEKRASDLAKEMADIRKKVVKKYSMTYKMIKDGEDNQPVGEEGKLSEQVLDKMADYNNEKEEKLFDDLRKEINSRIASDTESVDKVIPKQIANYELQLIKAKTEAKDYSFSNYVEELSTHRLNAEYDALKVKKLKMLKTHLEEARKLHNKKAEYINNAADAFDKEKAKVFDQIKYLTETLNLNKKPGHSNSPEFQAIEAQLKVFYDPEKHTKGIDNMTPEQLKQNLVHLKAVTEHYKSEKLDQKLHWIPSGQRKYRLSVSDNIISFTDQHFKIIDAMKLDAQTLETLNSAKEHPVTIYNDIKEFAAEASIQKKNLDNQISGFSKIVNEVNRDIKCDLGNQYDMSEDAKKEAIKSAIISREIRKKMWDFDPTKQELGAHILMLQDTKQQATTMIEHELGSGQLDSFMKKALQDTKDKRELQAGTIERRRDKRILKKTEFASLKNYDIEAQDKLDKNIQKQLEKGAKLNVIV
jgi:hypothetical protein